MGFWTIILAIFVGLAAFVVLFVIYALCSPAPTKEQLVQLNKKLAHPNVMSPEKRAWLKSPKNPINKVFPYNLIH